MSMFLIKVKRELVRVLSFDGKTHRYNTKVYFLGIPIFYYKWQSKSEYLSQWPQYQSTDDIPKEYFKNYPQYLPKEDMLKEPSSNH